MTEIRTTKTIEEMWTVELRGDHVRVESASRSIRLTLEAAATGSWGRDIPEAVRAAAVAEVAKATPPPLLPTEFRWIGNPKAFTFRVTPEGGFFRATDGSEDFRALAEIRHNAKINIYKDGIARALPVWEAKFVRELGDDEIRMKDGKPCRVKLGGGDTIHVGITVYRRSLDLTPWDSYAHILWQGGDKGLGQFKRLQTIRDRLVAD